MLVALGILIVSLNRMDAPWEGQIGRHLQQGARLKFEESVKVGLWWGLCGDALLLGLLLAASPWWMEWAGGGETNERTAPALQMSGKRHRSKRPRLWLGIGLGIACLLRAGHMDAPVTRDEQDTVRARHFGIRAAG